MNGKMGAIHPDSPAIATTGLRKEYGEKVAVADLTLTVRRGEIFGFLGPNGAGKTTAVKMLLGLVHPTGGSGEVLGAPLGDHAVRARIGFLPEHFRFHGWLTGVEFLRLHGRLHGVDERALDRRIPELLELVGLAADGRVRLGAYSKGMLQRVGIAQALVNEPDLVVFDEPTSGLDPFGRRLVRDIVRDLGSLGKTVFINSHLLSEIEVTCSRVAFIRAGRVVRMVEVGEFEEAGVPVRVEGGGFDPVVLAGLDRWVEEIRLDDGSLAFTVRLASDLAAVNRYLVESGAEVSAFRPERSSLEDLFLRYIGSDTGK